MSKSLEILRAWIKSKPKGYQFKVQEIIKSIPELEPIEICVGLSYELNEMLTVKYEVATGIYNEVEEIPPQPPNSDFHIIHEIL